MDNINKYYDKLTPAAQNALSETAKQISSDIFERALELAHSKNTAEKEISLQDIIKAKEQLLSIGNEKEILEGRIRNLYDSIIFLGIVFIMLIMASLLMYREFIIYFSSGPLIISSDLIWSIIYGFLLAYTIFRGYSSSRTDRIKKYSSGKNTKYDVVERWKIIEKLTSVIMKEKDFPVNQTKSIGAIIGFLRTLLPGQNTDQLMQLLMTRNRILHEFYEPKESEIVEMIKFSNEIIHLLEESRK